MKLTTTCVRFSRPRVDHQRCWGIGGGDLV